MLPRESSQVISGASVRPGACAFDHRVRLDRVEGPGRRHHDLTGGLAVPLDDDARRSTEPVGATRQIGSGQPDEPLRAGDDHRLVHLGADGALDLGAEATLVPGQRRGIQVDAGGSVQQARATTLCRDPRTGLPTDLASDAPCQRDRVAAVVEHRATGQVGSQEIVRR